VVERLWRHAPGPDPESRSRSRSRVLSQRSPVVRGKGRIAQTRMTRVALAQTPLERRSPSMRFSSKNVP
jgi:hypothetical protein